MWWDVYTYDVCIRGFFFPEDKKRSHTLRIQESSSVPIGLLETRSDTYDSL
jgi:hypothetical protein